MDNRKNSTDGEILMLLVKRSRKEGREVAAALDITPGYLSTLYKKQSFKAVFKSRVAKYFGVDQSIFEEGIGYSIPFSNELVEEPGEIERLREELDRVLAENRRLEEALQREQGISDDLRKTLLLVAGRRRSN